MAIRAKGGEDMAGYEGKIANTGTQVVPAPHQTAKKGNGTVKTGEDLRAKK